MPDDQDREAAAALLDRVIDFLADPTHWHQGSWSGDGGRSLCVIATFSFQVDDEALGNATAPFQIALRAVTDQLGVSPYGPYLRDWNDDPRTSHEDLMLTLKRARATLP